MNTPRFSFVRCDIDTLCQVVEQRLYRWFQPDNRALVIDECHACHGKSRVHYERLLSPGSRVAGYFRDSGGDEQERSVDQQRRAAEKYGQQHQLVLVHCFCSQARTSGCTCEGQVFNALRSEFEALSLLMSSWADFRVQASPSAQAL